MRSASWGLMVAALMLCKVHCFHKRAKNNFGNRCKAEHMLAYIYKDFSQPVATFIYAQDSRGYYHDVRAMAGRCSYSVADTPAFIIFSVSHSSCHVQKTVHGGNITYWVNIAVVKVPASKQGSVIKDTFSKWTVSCTYELLKANSSTPVEVSTLTVTPAPILKNEGVLRAKIRFATDSSFRGFYKSQAPPVMHTLGKPVFLEIFVLKHEDKDLELLLNECWATPSPDPNDELRWSLLHRGCPRQDDEYTVEVLEVHPGDEVKYPMLHKRLKIAMFAFVESEDISESVYLHCDVEVCKRAQCPRTYNKIEEESV